MIGIYTICQAKSWMDYDAYIAPADGDYLLINDVDDDTDDASGTVKRLAWLYVQQRNANLTSLSTIAYSANMLSFLDAADYVAMRTLLAVLPLVGGTLTGNLLLDDDDSHSPTLCFVDENDETFCFYKDNTSGDFAIYTSTTTDRNIYFQNNGDGNVNIVVDGTISEGGTSLVSKYHPLEDQGLSTDDEPSFVSITTTAGATGNGGFIVDGRPDTDATCQTVDSSTHTSGANGIAFGDLVGLNSSGEYVKAYAEAGSVVEARGIACNAANDEDAIEVMRQGYIRLDSWEATFNLDGNMTDKLYLSDSTAGQFALSTNQPNDTGDVVQYIGNVEPSLNSGYQVIYVNIQPRTIVLD